MKGIGCRMVEWAVVASLLFSSSGCSGSEAGAALGRAEVPQGEYHGQIWSDAMRKSVTEFYGETRNGIDGTYRFEYGGGLEEGVLVDCKRLTGVEFRCRWKDGWGVGQLDLKFSADLSSFTGVWSDKHNPPSLGLRWHGARR
jgi:hypothetical protein